MRYKHWLQLAAGVLLSVLLLSSPIANAQRGARAYRAGTITRPAARVAPSRSIPVGPLAFMALAELFPEQTFFPVVQQASTESITC